MKWYITEPAPVAEGINTVRIVQKEMGSEAAGVALKWPYRPIVTRPVTVDQPVYAEELDADGNPIQTGTEMVESQQPVDYPYIIEDGEVLRDATDEERTAIDTALSAQQEAARLAAEAAEIERKNTPLVFDQPIETPVLVLQSETAGVGVGIIADDAGALIPFTYHASPVPSPAEIRARKDAALAARQATKLTIAAKGAQFKSENAAANSVPRLRAALVSLQEQVAALMTLVGAGN